MVAVSLLGLHVEHEGVVLADGVLVILVVDQETSGEPKAAGQDVVVLVIPIAYENNIVVGWGIQGDWDEEAIADAEVAKTSHRFLEADGGEEDVAADLIL